MSEPEAQAKTDNVVEETTPHSKTIEIKGKRIDLKGLGIFAKGITREKATQLHIENYPHDFAYNDYRNFDVFNSPESEQKEVYLKTRLIREGLEKGCDVDFGDQYNPKEKLLLIKFTHKTGHVLYISVPDKGRTKTDWRPFNRSGVMLKANEKDIDYITQTILDSHDEKDVEEILNSVVQANVNSSFGELYNLDDRIALIHGGDEILEHATREDGKLYYYNDKTAIDDLLRKNVTYSTKK